jgi:hypothetical protein
VTTCHVRFRLHELHPHDYNFHAARSAPRIQEPSCSSSRCRVIATTSPLLTFITCQTPSSALDGSICIPAQCGSRWALFIKSPESWRVTPVPGPSIRVGPKHHDAEKREGISSMLIKKWWFSFSPLFICFNPPFISSFCVSSHS